MKTFLPLLMTLTCLSFAPAAMAQSDAPRKPQIGDLALVDFCVPRLGADISEVRVTSIEPDGKFQVVSPYGEHTIWRLKHLSLEVKNGCSSGHRKICVGDRVTYYIFPNFYVDHAVVKAIFENGKASLEGSNEVRSIRILRNE